MNVKFHNNCETQVNVAVKKKLRDSYTVLY